MYGQYLKKNESFGLKNHSKSVF